MLTAETVTKSLPSVTPHTPLSSLSLLHPHSPPLFTVYALPTHPHFLSSSDLTSCLCLTACVWLPRTARQSEGAGKRRGMRNCEGGGGGWVGVVDCGAGGISKEDRETVKRTNLWERKKTGRRSLGMRLGTKTEGNWETKSEPGIRGEEERGRDEREEGGGGLGGCEARITTNFCDIISRRRTDAHHWFQFNSYSCSHSLFCWSLSQSWAEEEEEEAQDPMLQMFLMIEMHPNDFPVLQVYVTATNMTNFNSVSGTSAGKKKRDGLMSVLVNLT